MVLLRLSLVEVSWLVQQRDGDRNRGWLVVVILLLVVSLVWMRKGKDREKGRCDSGGDEVVAGGRCSSKVLERRWREEVEKGVTLG